VPVLDGDRDAIGPVGVAFADDNLGMLCQGEEAIAQLIDLFWIFVGPNFFWSTSIPFLFL
jgi:hypothetical protein